jgi:hypothetical protein
MAMDVLEKERPDLVVFAWPCSPWSQMQQISQRTAAQKEALNQKRRYSHRVHLAFVRRVFEKQTSE